MKLKTPNRLILPESPQTPPYFVPSDAHTDDDELRLPRVENLPSEAALAAGVVAAEAATGDRSEEKALEPEDESAAETPDELSGVRMDDSGSAPTEEEPVDELAAAVSEDSGMPSDEPNVEAVDEPIELHTDDRGVATSEEERVDDLSAGSIDDENIEPTPDVIPAEAKDDLLTDVTWPEDEDKTKTRIRSNQCCTGRGADRRRSRKIGRRTF